MYYITTISEFASESDLENYFRKIGFLLASSTSRMHDSIVCGGHSDVPEPKVVLHEEPWRGSLLFGMLAYESDDSRPVIIESGRSREIQWPLKKGINLFVTLPKRDTPEFNYVDVG